ANVAFALSVDPENPVLQSLRDTERKGPSTMAEEVAANPFYTCSTSLRPFLRME
ncbi:hypothetical protein KIPB_016123, partial [Kipferlia bialata]